MTQVPPLHPFLEDSMDILESEIIPDFCTVVQNRLLGEFDGVVRFMMSMAD
jgi:hypothetical protein